MIDNKEDKETSTLADLRVPDDLDERLRAAVRQSLTPEEIRLQSISFAMGMLSFDSTTTREYIEDLVNSQYG